MLHLRLIVPADRTEAVVRTIEKTVGTTHLVVLPGAARDPAGDVVMCDVAREAGDGLLGELRGLGLDETGSIAVENIDLSLSKRADTAEEEAPGEGADAGVLRSYELGGRSLLVGIRPLVAIAERPGGTGGAAGAFG
ncbi:hypothetical protein SANTM175S_10488 [Streptomyces antimycoticus]